MIDYKTLKRLGELVKNVGYALLTQQANPVMRQILDLPLRTSAMDKWCHEYLVRELRKLTPAIPIISEEDSNSFDLIDVDKFWIIDPIDGTSSWLDGFDGYVVQIALIGDGDPIASCIYWPRGDCLWSFSRTVGIFFSGSPPDDAITAPSLIDNYPSPSGLARRFLALDESLNRSFRYVEKGGVALKSLYVCQGWASLFVKDVPLKLWDIAPVMPFARKSGTQILDSDLDLIGCSSIGIDNGLIVTGLEDSFLETVDWKKIMNLKDNDVQFE